MSVLPTIIKRDAEQWAYQVYITDTLQAIAENTAILDVSITHGELPGKIMTRRWADFGKPAPPEETRTPEEIIAQIKAKAAALKP